MLNIKQS